MLYSSLISCVNCLKCNLSKYTKYNVCIYYPIKYKHALIDSQETGLDVLERFYKKLNKNLKPLEICSELVFYVNLIIVVTILLFLIDYSSTILL